MRVLGWVIVISMAMALAGVVAKVAVLIVLGLILVSFITAPREMALTLFGFLLLGLIAAHPVPGLLLLAAIVVFGIRQQGRE